MHLLSDVSIIGCAKVFACVYWSVLTNCQGFRGFDNVLRNVGAKRHNLEYIAPLQTLFPTFSIHIYYHLSIEFSRNILINLTIDYS